jgi:glutamate dehydrogenase
MSDSADSAKDALLAEAAGSVQAGLAAEAALLAEGDRLADAGVGDLLRFLHAYYRHVPVEELAAAGPARLRAVAVEHARLAASRPQGRAQVRVRPAAGNAAFAVGRAVVDIVTDDMPFLVDSLSMALSRHDLDSDLVVHPQLLVRRNVAGALREVAGPLSDVTSGTAATG